MQAYIDAVNKGLHPLVALATLVRDPRPPEWMAQDPELLPELEKVAAADPQLQLQALSPGQIPGVTDPVTGEFRQTGSAAPFAPVAQSAVILPGDTRRQQLEAERAVKEVPAELRTVREQQQNVETMLRLLEKRRRAGRQGDGRRQAVHPGEVRLDVGQDPGLQTFRSLAQADALTAAQNLRGAMSDRDIQFLQDLGGHDRAGHRGQQGHPAHPPGINERRGRGSCWPRRNTTSGRGFDQWLQAESAKWGPVVLDELVRKVTSDFAASASQEAAAFQKLAKAIQDGDAAAVNSGRRAA